MKSFNIDRSMKDKDIIRLAIQKVCKNKKKRKGKPTKKYRQAQRILADIEKYVDRIYLIICETEQKNRAIRRGTYCEGEFPLAFSPKISGSFTRKCENGKIRKITSVPVFPDQIIHQLLVMSAEGVFMRGMYRYSCGSIPKRGVHKGKQCLQRYINRNKYNSKIKYAAQLDIKKCYPHIRHDFLKEMIRKKFRGNLFVDICFDVIDCYSEDGTPGVGLPIGFYTSQWFCNFFMTPIDMHIKQNLHTECLVRYVDDMTLFGPNKKRLHRTVDKISELATEKGLEIKGNWQVFRFDYFKGTKPGEEANLTEAEKKERRRGRAIDTLGFRFFRDKTILRKRNALSIRRAALQLHKKKKITAADARSFMSKIGPLKHCNSKRFWKEYIKPFVNIKKLKEIISNEDRKQYQAGSGSG